MILNFLLPIVASIALSMICPSTCEWVLLERDAKSFGSKLLVTGRDRGLES